MAPTRHTISEEIFNKAENIISTSLDHEIHFDFIFFRRSLLTRWKQIYHGMMGRYETSVDWMGVKKSVHSCWISLWPPVQLLSSAVRVKDKKNRASRCALLKLKGRDNGAVHFHHRHFDIWKGKANTSSCILSSCIRITSSGSCVHGHIFECEKKQISCTVTQTSVRDEMRQPAEWV